MTNSIKIKKKRKRISSWQPQSIKPQALEPLSPVMCLSARPWWPGMEVEVWGQEITF